MKKFSLLLIITLFLQGCIENDVINDRIDEKISINNPIKKLTVKSTHQFTTKYINNVGEVKTVPITWESSDTSIISVSNTGLVTGIKKGEAKITASAISDEGKTVSVENEITVTEEEVDNSGPIEKTGTIVTTSSYALSGTFTLKEIPNTNDIELSINSNYNASTSLPGLYLYLTNNPNTVNGAKEVSKVLVFNGAHKYVIKNVGINDFSHLLYWCKPFRVKVGQAEIK